MIKDPHLRAIRFGARNNASYERERQWRNGKWAHRLTFRRWDT